MAALPTDQREVQREDCPWATSEMSAYLAPQVDGSGTSLISPVRAGPTSTGRRIRSDMLPAHQMEPVGIPAANGCPLFRTLTAYLTAYSGQSVTHQDALWHKGVRLPNS